MNVAVFFAFPSGLDPSGVTVENNKFSIGTADVKIKVTFKATEQTSYGIIVEDDGHGTASADVNSAAPGATVTLIATPKDGYAFKEWHIERGLESITGDSFTMPSNEVKVKAIFERVYNITLQTNDHGTASATVGGQTATTAAANAEVTLTATPDEGYQFKEWKTVSGDISVTKNKFTMSTSNVTVQAMFEAIAPTEHTVTFDLNGITGTAPEVQTIEKDGKVTKQISHKQGGEGNALSALCLS